MNEFMKKALEEAKKAYKKNEVPVGAIIVKNNKIIAKSHNTKQYKYDVLGHAEINCIKKAAKKNKDWRLNDCTMYVTLAPCDLCQMCIEKSRISKIYYLLDQDEIKINNNKYIRTNDCDNIKIEYEKILNSFFEKLRK